MKIVMSLPVMPAPSTSSVQLLRAADVAARLRIKRPRIYALMKHAGLPEPIRLSGKTVCWVQSEVEAWIASRPRAGRSTTNTNAPAGTEASSAHVDA